VRPANLAGRPFVNERLPNLVFALAVVLLVAVTARHAFLVRALLPGRTSALHDEVTRLEEESKRLRAEQATLRGVAPEPKALARWIVIKELVDRRAFSWTALFARLEERLPDGARLVSITPGLRRGEIMLDVDAVVRSPEVGWEFMRALEEDGAFDDVFPLSEGEGGEFHYTMRYKPRAVTAAVASPAPDPSAPPGGAAEDQAEQGGEEPVEAAGTVSPRPRPEAKP
jgi:Tfp pilus assembly protein PilN